MNATIRVRLTPPSEQILLFMSTINKTSKKEYISGLINEYYQLFKDPKIPIKNAIKGWKEDYKKNAGKTKSYALNPDSKNMLKSLSKARGLNMGILLSMMITMHARSHVDSLKKEEKSKPLYDQLYKIKEKISGDISKMKALWEKILEIYELESEEEIYGYYEIDTFLTLFDEL